MKKIDWKRVFRVCSWINLAYQFWSLGYANGTHVVGFMLYLNIFNVVGAIYFLRRALKTLPALTIVNHNHPILVPKAVVIIDAEFEEIPSERLSVR